MNHTIDIHRERLIDALWPDATLASGTRSLQVAASNVRQCLAAAGFPAGSLQRHADAYSLHLRGARFDIGLFEGHIRRAARQDAAGDAAAALRSRLAALEGYGGDLLPELGPAEWVVAERERLRLVAATTAADAARGALELDQMTTGLRAAQRSLELDPYRDTSWLFLAELYERLGDQTAAAVTRREHVRVCAGLDLRSWPLRPGAARERA